MYDDISFDIGGKKKDKLLSRIASLEAERDRLAACLNAANEQAEHFERQWYLMTDERDQLQDKLADAESSMLRRFDPAAAESTDLFTWITCMLAKRDRLRNRIVSLEDAVHRGIDANVDLRNERDQLRAELAECHEIFAWLLGEAGEFQARQEGQGAYYWRTDLRKRIAALAGEWETK